MGLARNLQAGLMCRALRLLPDIWPEGYIYPAGTLDDGVEGTNPGGSPAFPDKAIGQWICDGVFVADGMRTERGTILISRQPHSFGDGDLLISQGPEKTDVNQPFDRVVSGGTGDFAGIDAVLRQTFLGMSDNYGVRVQIELIGGAEQAAYAPPIGAAGREAENARD